MPFYCVSCMEQYPGQSAADLAGNAVCQPCFDSGYRRQFEDYLRDESQPVLIGGQTISIDTVRHQFTAKFVAQYRARMAEYAVSPGQRLYCPPRPRRNCGKYLGQKTSTKTSKRCGDCGASTCTHCGGNVTTNITRHICPAATAEDEDEDPFQGQVRGRDYQRCPRCSIPIERAEACNHIHCPRRTCNTEFCYICGQQADMGSGHWDHGRPCPIYGRPGDIRAIHNNRQMNAGLLDFEQQIFNQMDAGGGEQFVLPPGNQNQNQNQNNIADQHNPMAQQDRNRNRIQQPIAQQNNQNQQAHPILPPNPAQAQQATAENHPPPRDADHLILDTERQQRQMAEFRQALLGRNRNFQHDNNNNDMAHDLFQHQRQQHQQRQQQQQQQAQQDMRQRMGLAGFFNPMPAGFPPWMAPQRPLLPMMGGGLMPPVGNMLGVMMPGNGGGQGRGGRIPADPAEIFARNERMLNRLVLDEGEDLFAEFLFGDD